jgi:L-gulono-1,4-lactone dehydrogenase
LRALYPRYDAWKAIYLRFNAGTFDGKVTDRLGISVRPRI